MAVGHLRHHFAAAAAGGGEHFGIRLRLAVKTENRAVLRSGDQRHNIVNKSAAGLQPTADVGHAAVVNPRDQHRVYLHQHPLAVSRLTPSSWRAMRISPASRPL